MPAWCRRLLRPEAGFFLLCWLGLMWAFQARAFNDPGALWHVKVGELILDHGFMTTDPFTYTFAGRTWIPQQWGGEVLMALAHRAAGLDAMLLGFAAGVAGLFTWVFSRTVRNGVHPALAALFVGGAGVVAAFHFYARPHMFTILGMAVTAAAIVDYERGRASAWRLWWLIPFNVLWTNVHGGVLGGVLTLGLAVAGWGVMWLCSRYLGRKQNRGDSSTSPLEGEVGETQSSRVGGCSLHPPPAGTFGSDDFPLTGGGVENRPLSANTPIRSWRTAFLLIGVVAACGLTPFVNPFGMEMLRTWQKIVGSDAMKELVSEHQPLSLALTPGRVVVGFAVFYLFALLGTLPKWPRVSWLLPLVWFALSLKGIRQGPLFVVVGAVMLADLWPHTLWHRLLKKHGDSLARDPEESPRSWGWAAVAAAFTLVVLGVQLTGITAPVVGRGWARLSPRYVPVELADDLRTATAGRRLFNDANLGGFVIYHAPGVPVFMDDRFELYGDPWIREYVAVVYDHPERFDGWADEYRFDLALVANLPGGDRLPLEKYLSESPRWVVLSRCERGVLFRRAE